MTCHQAICSQHLTNFPVKLVEAIPDSSSITLPTRPMPRLLVMFEPRWSLSWLSHVSRNHLLKWESAQTFDSDS